MQTVPRYLTTCTPENYTLHLTLNRHERTFSGELTFTGSLAQNADALYLHAKDLTIDTITINDQSAEWSHGDMDELRITLPEDSHDTIVAHISYHSSVTDSLHGLYRSQFTHENTTHDIFVTQFESHHAREMMPCIDEPAAKATFDVTVTTENGVVILGNMPSKSETSTDTHTTVTFDTTPHMSTYLLALVIGPLHCKEATTKDGVVVRTWATLAQSPESLDFALEHSVRSIEFFNEYFGVPYPLPKSDSVALPDFSSGAMENWGLVTYREHALLADPATTTLSSKQYIALVISHELSHQWFGNLVTMKWWNNLWLNESFATIMEYIAVDAIHPEWNVWLDFAAHESILSLRRDAIDGVQPVQVEVHHPDEIATLFDPAIVYAKGARLMNMLRTFVGESAFRAGLKQYFTDHAYSNTDENDLWNALSTASGKDVQAFMTPWISQPGYPVIHVDETGLRQEQFFIGEHDPSNRYWGVPLAPSSPEDLPEILDTPQLATPISIEERLNIHNASHTVINYSQPHLDYITSHIYELSDVERLARINEQILLARGGYTSSAQLVPLLRAYSSETTEQVWSLMSLAISELRQFIDNDTQEYARLQAFVLTLARPMYERLGWNARPNESEHDTKLRPTIVALMAFAEDADVIAHIDTAFADTDLVDLDPELRGVILSDIVRRNTDSALLTSLIDHYTTTQHADLREDLASALTDIRQPDQVRTVLSLLRDTSIVRTQDTGRWFAYLMRNRYARTATWQWMRDDWKWIEETFKGDKSYDNFPRYAGSALRTQEEYDQYVEFFAPYRDTPSLGRLIVLGENEIHARIELLARDTEAVKQALLA